MSVQTKYEMPIKYVGTLVDYFADILNATKKFKMVKYSPLKSLPKGVYVGNVYVNNISNRELSVVNRLVDISIGIEIYYFPKPNEQFTVQWPLFLEHMQYAYETISAKSGFPVGLSKLVVNSSFDQEDINNRPTLWAGFECICSVFAQDRR